MQNFGWAKKSIMVNSKVANHARVSWQRCRVREPIRKMGRKKSFLRLVLTGDGVGVVVVRALQT